MPETADSFEHLPILDELRDELVCAFIADEQGAHRPSSQRLQVRRQPASRQAVPSRRRGKRARWAGRRLVAGATAVAAAVGAALVLLLGATATTPAFAVTRNHDGTVTVKILRYSGVAGANRKLHQLGIRARVMQTPPTGCTPTLSHPPGDQSASAPSHGIANAHWTINPNQIPTGSRLALTPPPSPPAQNDASSGNSVTSGNSGTGGSGGEWYCGTEGPGPGGPPPSPRSGRGGNSVTSANS